MTIKLIKHITPKLDIPEFLCDSKLSKHLDDDALLKNMNKSFICGLIGKGGSGKTTLMAGLLQTKNKYKKVFNKIYVFMPESSRKSMRKDVFECLPDEQKFDNVRHDDLTIVYEELIESSKNKHYSLLVFDDVQSYLKDTLVEKLLLHIISNRRHLRTSIFLLCQNWKKIPIQIRIVFTDTFLFNVSKEELKYIYEEIINVSKQDFSEILAYIERKN